MFKLTKVQKLQSEFMRRLFISSSPEKFLVPSILPIIAQSSDDLIEFGLGKIGLKLKDLLESVDSTHPEIINFLDGIIADDQAFSRNCIEILKIAEFARSNNLLNVVPEFGRQIIKTNISRQIIKQLDSPKNNRMYVRLLPDPEERQKIRTSKRLQSIDLAWIYKKGDEVWNSLPENFDKFLRFDSAYQDQIEQAERKAQRYLQLGCESLASEINKSIVEFKENMHQAYFGFNRITMTNASVILAKSLGFNFSIEKNVIQDSCEVLKTNGAITVPREFFGELNFYSDAMNQREILFDYEPRVYPYHELSDLASEQVKQTIEVLESFPDAGNKPIFDHFGIIVPSVKLFQLHEKLYTFLDENGVLQSYNEREDAVRSLDRILIKKNCFHPVIMGERDGKCYFICYF